MNYFQYLVKPGNNFRFWIFHLYFFAVQKKLLIIYNKNGTDYNCNRGKKIWISWIG